MLRLGLELAYFRYVTINTQSKLVNINDEFEAASGKHSTCWLAISVIP